MYCYNKTLALILSVYIPSCTHKHTHTQKTYLVQCYLCVFILSLIAHMQLVDIMTSVNLPCLVLKRFAHFSDFQSDLPIDYPPSILRVAQQIALEQCKKHSFCFLCDIKFYEACSTTQRYWGWG